MNQPSSFLTAEWRRLILANYAVAPSVLQPFVPEGTELDTWNGRCYVSLVGFMFLNTRIKGIAIPFHSNFEEVNLRFYVKRIMPEGSIRRGVTFIKEIVPKAAISIVANTVYKEPYETMPMRHSWKEADGMLDIQYEWKKEKWHSLRVLAASIAEPIAAGSEAEFITEHYWGYTKTGKKRASEYPVEHPRWEIYPVKEYAVNVNFGKVYGAEFGFLSNEKPVSVMLAEGSGIVVRSGTKM